MHSSRIEATQKVAIKVSWQQVGPIGWKKFRTFCESARLFLKNSHTNLIEVCEPQEDSIFFCTQNRSKI